MNENRDDRQSQSAPQKKMFLITIRQQIRRSRVMDSFPFSSDLLEFQAITPPSSPIAFPVAINCFTNRA